VTVTPLMITVEQLELLDTDTLDPTVTELDPSPEVLTSTFDPSPELTVTELDPSPELLATTFDPSPEPTVTVEEDDVVEDTFVLEDEDVFGFHVGFGAGGGLYV